MINANDGKRKKIIWRTMIVAGIILIAVFTSGIIREYLRRKALDKEIASLEQELNKLKLDKNNFLSTIDAYKSDFFTEQEARLKFDYKKEGEKVIIIPTEKLALLPNVNNSNEQSKNNDAIIEKNSNVKNWWNYFFSGKS